MGDGVGAHRCRGDRCFTYYLEVYLGCKLPALRLLSISHQWLLPDLAEFKFISRLFLKSVLWLLDKDSSLQLSPLDEVQAGRFLALRPSGTSHKRTLSTLRQTLTQVPPTYAPHHHPTLLTLLDQSS
ncbi:hypothetical protein AMECASPLE_022295 [Ameca splendens]|uniref:Uncharacterized protein n=1 Tax=Ameca splendens TaxID=208324 RepID=A0ABV0ZEJ7_9TELE